MPKLNLKPTHKAVKDYFMALEQFDRLGLVHESTVRSAFQNLLASCGRKFKWTLVAEYSIRLQNKKRIVVDGALIDNFTLVHGHWEAKDIRDNLEKEVKRKFQDGYPRDNILFQTPKRAILWQNGVQVRDVDLTEPSLLIDILQTYFAYRPHEISNWEEAVAQFKDRVPDIGRGLSRLIKEQRHTNRLFAVVFEEFLDKCRSSINPNLSEAAVEEMLIQHLLTERIFRTVFSNPDFTTRNVIAYEIEKVITALTSQSFSRDEFLKGLDRFYLAIERTAETINDFSQKQFFLNTVYEQFFQGFSVRVADTHGIVYTPQAIVDFMVRSIEYILKTRFDRSLVSSNVHILDPFVGTGNFIMRFMRELPRTALKAKYLSELHCNEVMLLPYYIASMYIEHAFYEATGKYQPFEGICLVDTFELAEEQQASLFVAKNTQRVTRQNEAKMFVIVGNPPYNAGQINENDNNKNRQYEAIDKRVADTYGKDSNATLINKLSDPYVKAIRWATDRIGEEGVVAFVTNNGFIDGVAFDGMRKHLERDFTEIYHIDLKGNARTSGERRKREGGNVFHNQIRVGVGITFLIKMADSNSNAADVWIYSVDDYLKAREKQSLLDRVGDLTNVPMIKSSINAKNIWMTQGLRADFDSFIPIATKEARRKTSEATGVVFKTYSLGVSTNRDAWARNFNRNVLAKNMKRSIETYNEQVYKWERRKDRDANIDDFVLYDDRKISWSSTLKQNLKSMRIIEFSDGRIRQSLYRPFTLSNIYFDRVMNDRVLLYPSIFPTSETEVENRVICLSAVGNKKPFHCLMAQQISDLHLTGDSQCFPLYTYDEDGTNRGENITDWALGRFCNHYRDDTITKWSIFHYVYALLHHADYRERYQANLRRDLPHIPPTPDFWAFAEAGARLAKIHACYEEQPKYHLNHIENPKEPLNWRVEKMKLSKDKTQIEYNEFLTLGGIPAKTFDYQLGNRSALEWVIDQYRVKVDKRSGIKSDPNRAEDERYIVRLIGKVITVSVETVEIVEGLPELGIPED